MSSEIKTIAVLTSGGDAPGMNAAIRAVTRTALYEGKSIIGIEDGYRGLYENKFIQFGAGSVADIIQRGGTFIGTARLPEFEHDVSIRERCYQNLRDRGIDALVVLGGDGSFHAAKLFNEEGNIPTAGIPCTIDNDIACSDYTIGFDTAVNTCLSCINNLRDTMAAHERLSVVEVMGRNCGDIAIHAGIAGGAEAILIPELDWNAERWLEYVVSKLKLIQRRDKHFGIIVMAEGVRFKKGMDFFTPDYIASWLKEKKETTGVALEARGITLSHIQRGGSPSASDRILASRLGEHAVRKLISGEKGFCVGIINNKLVSMSYADAFERRRVPDMELVELANILAM